MNEIREVLRAWLAGAGLRTAAERAGVDRKTARRYVEAGEAAGLLRDGAVGGEGQLTDELIGVVVLAVRPARATGHGAAWEDLVGWKEKIASWVKADLQLTNIHGKLERQGVVVPYRTLHRFATEQCGFGGERITLRVADGKAWVECQIEPGRGHTEHWFESACHAERVAAGGMTPGRTGLTLAERTAQSRATGQSASPASESPAAPANTPITEGRAGAPRHWWVTGLDPSDGRCPGLLAEWSRRGDAATGGWFGRVVYAIIDDGRVVLVEAWIPARHLHPSGP